MERLISVIIPVYNGENWLDRCVDAVINQTYKNLEIVIIDDGSTDTTPEMCERYCKLDSRVKVIHRQNGGLADARNAGIEYSSGEYITFVDSDDYITPDCVEYLAGLISTYGCDMSICTHTVFCINEREISYENDREGVMTAEEALREILYHGIVDLSVWGKLYKRELFDCIKYPYGKFYEDTGTTYLLINAAKKVAYGGRSKYHYILREDSMTNAKFTTRKMDLLEMTDRMCNFISEHYPSLRSAALRRSVYARFSTLNQMIREAGYRTERRKIVKFIRKHSREVLRDKNIPKRDRIALNLIRLGYPLYHTVWRMYLALYKNW